MKLGNDGFGWECGGPIEEIGVSYFCSWSKYFSAVGTAPQETSSVFVLARTSWTRPGAAGFSVSKNQKSLKQTCMAH